jgi:hypothetical protein
VTTRPPPSKPQPPRRRPWSRPRVQSGKLFESNSLACNKVAKGGMCADNPPVTTS